MPIILFGLTVYEPMTVFTNIILALICAWMFKKEHSLNGLWAMFFLFLGLSTLIAAVGHGYSELSDNPVKFWSRAFAIVSVYFGGMASLSSLGEKRIREWLKWILSIQALAFFLWLTLDNTFLPIKLSSLFGLGLIVLGLHLYSFSRFSFKQDLWIIGGIVVNASAAIVNTYKWSFGPNFSYHDIGHVIMMVGIFIMYRGITNYKLRYAT